MKPHTIIHRYPEGLVLTATQPDPTVVAAWQVERVQEHPWNPSTRSVVDSGMCRSLEAAMVLGVAVVEAHTAEGGPDV